MIRYFPLLFICLSAPGASWYVSPTGTGNGTLVSPGNLNDSTAGTNWGASIAPGDTVLLRGGTYSNYQWDVSISGTTNNLITWKSYTNEWAKIDGIWRFPGPSVYHRFQDFDSYDSKKATRWFINGGGGFGSHIDTSALDGTDMSEWLNLVIHDTCNVWSGEAGNIVRGCIIWYCGQDAREHVIYSDNYDFYGNICAFTAGQTTQGGHNPQTVTSNIFFGQGLTINQRSTEILTSFNPVIRGNAFYATDGGQSRGTQLATNSNGTGFVSVSNNTIAGEFPIIIENGSYNEVKIGGNTFIMTRSAENGQEIAFDSVTSSLWVIDGNDYYARSPQSVIFNDNTTTRTFAQWKSANPIFDTVSSAHNSTLPVNMVMVMPNRDKPKRAHIAVYNWTQADNVSVNLASTLSTGDIYQLYSAQNYSAGPILSGTFGGSTISVPMTNLTTATILYGTNMVQPSPTSPEFAAFIVQGQPGLTLNVINLNLGSITHP